MNTSLPTILAFAAYSILMLGSIILTGSTLCYCYRFRVWKREWDRVLVRCTTLILLSTYLVCWIIMIEDKAEEVVGPFRSVQERGFQQTKQLVEKD